MRWEIIPQVVGLFAADAMCLYSQRRKQSTSPKSRSSEMRACQ
jgi:hypothetical protein